MIYLQIQNATADRYRIIYIHYPDPYGNIPAGGDVIPLSYVTNATVNINGTSLFELMRAHHGNDKAILKKISDTEYEIDFRIANVRKYKIKQLRGYINRIIAKNFPVDSQLRYMTFMRLHEQSSLTQSEQYIYDIELHNRPEAAVWTVVSDKVKWLYDVYDAENNYVDTINNMSNIKALLQLSVNDIVLPVAP